MSKNNQSISIKELKWLKTITNADEFLEKIGVPAPYAEARGALLRVLETLREELVVVIEYEYVDLMYRNEYYNFYATKKYEYKRNCAKLSFFEPNALKEEIDLDYSEANIAAIKKDYLGFLVVRPLAKCVGRNAISVNAKKNKYRNVRICETDIQSSALGLSLSVKAFPHSSQDAEMMRCAETALWSLFEYFGHKYSKHRTALPSEIHQSIASLSYQRQTPSQGLRLDQMSAALKNMGLNPIIYNARTISGSDSETKIRNIKWSFQAYVDSGIPVLLFLSEPSGHSSDAHATVCIGKDKGTHHQNFAFDKFVWRKTTINEIVINDDNVPNYQIASYDEPTSYYDDWKNEDELQIEDWKKFREMRIENFIVPLPSRVYMDAYTAYNLVCQLKMDKWIEDDKITRTILVGSRSLRDHIATSRCLANGMKTNLLQLPLPHYVWITELYTEKGLDEGDMSGIIIVDATDKFSNTSNLIFCFAKNKKGYYDIKTNKFEFLKYKDNDFVLEMYNKSLN